MRVLMGAMAALLLLGASGAAWGQSSGTATYGKNRNDGKSTDSKESKPPPTSKSGSRTTCYGSASGKNCN